jgi:hypothetical protein
MRMCRYGRRCVQEENEMTLQPDAAPCPARLHPLRTAGRRALVKMVHQRDRVRDNGWVRRRAQHSSPRKFFAALQTDGEARPPERAMAGVEQATRCQRRRSRTAMSSPPHSTPKTAKERTLGCAIRSRVLAWALWPLTLAALLACLIYLETFGGSMMGKVDNTVRGWTVDISPRRSS